MDWDKSKKAYSSIGLEMYDMKLDYIDFINIELCPDLEDSRFIAEVSQTGTNGMDGTASAQFREDLIKETKKELDHLIQHLLKKFSFLESANYTFSNISPTLALIHFKLRENAFLPESVMNVFTDEEKRIKESRFGKGDESYKPTRYDNPVTNRKMGCLFGLAVGDALGATVEFQSRGEFEPVTDMRSGGDFNLEAGVWTDDTAMALCLGQSLIDKKGFDPKDQMEKYLEWLDNGYMSATGQAIGLGMTIDESLNKYRLTGNPFCGSTDPLTAGNGTIMKLAPVPMYYHPDHEAAVRYSIESCKTTHKAQEVLDAASAMASILCYLFDGKDKSEALEMVRNKSFKSGSVLAILNSDFNAVNPGSIESSGYVIHTLNAALWAFMTSSSFEEAVLKAVNLGDDADTVGAVCGQFAGAFWGYSKIPEKWLKKIARFGLIKEVGMYLSKIAVMNRIIES